MSLRWKQKSVARCHRRTLSSKGRRRLHSKGFLLESPMAPVVVERPVGGQVLYLMLPPFCEVVADKLGWLHTPELVDVVLATQQGHKLSLLNHECLLLRAKYPMMLY